MVNNRNSTTCFKCGEQGHMRMDCKEQVFCTHCRTANHDTKACRKHHNNTPSPMNSHIPAGYHPTTTPPPVLGTAVTGPHTQQTVQPNNTPLFQNLFVAHQPRTSTTIPHPVQWRIISTIGQYDRSHNTDHSTSCQQQQEG